MVRVPFRQSDDDLPPGVRFVPSLGIRVGRVFSYNRVSLAQQARAGQGVQRQIQDSEAFCREHGLELDNSLRLIDAGRSAFKGHHLAHGGDLRRFLELAEAGQLGSHPLLIIEALDRISRLAMFEALDRILIPLFRAGVTILSLEDNEFYDQRSISEDGGMRMMRLVIRIEEASKHSKRLRHRMERSWEMHRELLRSGVIKRPRAFCPSWCDYSEETGYTLNEKAAGVRRAFELLRHHGFEVTARMLNAEGYPGLRNSPTWTRTSVCMLLRREQVYGAIRLGATDDARRGEARSHRLFDGETATPWQERGDIVEGFLPAAVPKDEVLAIRALVSRRSTVERVSMPNGVMHWFGQRITYCACGRTCESQKSWTGGEKRYVRYLRCRRGAAVGQERCAMRGVRMEHVSHHVLARLQPQQLALLLGGGEANPEVDHLRQRIQRGEQELRSALERQQRFNEGLTKLLEDGQDVVELLPHRETIRRSIAEQQEALAEARAQLVILETPLDLGRANAAFHELRRALAAGDSTPEQRCDAHNALRDLNITIHIHGSDRVVGLRVGDGPIDWQPLLPEVAQAAVEEGLHSVQFSVDAKGREIAAEP